MLLCLVIFYAVFSSDINECTEGTHMCDTLAICTDTEGSYTCTCNSGYTGSGEMCIGKSRNIMECYDVTII